MLRNHLECFVIVVVIVFVVVCRGVCLAIGGLMERSLEAAVNHVCATGTQPSVMSSQEHVW